MVVKGPKLSKRGKNLFFHFLNSHIGFDRKCFKGKWQCIFLTSVVNFLVTYLVCELLKAIRHLVL